MFLFRSLFWLTLAFLVIAPHARIQESIQETARTAPWAALSATQAAVHAYAPHLACDSFECVAARTLLTAATAPAPTPAPEPQPAPAPEPEPAPTLDTDALTALIEQNHRPVVTADAPIPLPRPVGL